MRIKVIYNKYRFIIDYKHVQNSINKNDIKVKVQYKIVSVEM